MLIILDYGIGNLSSIKNMLKKAGCSDMLLSSQPEDVALADKIILPGVGHFTHCMTQLKQAPFYHVLEQRVLHERIPILGVCVGHQMLFEHSEEGDCAGLGWIPGQVVRFDKTRMAENLKIPHMAWTDVQTKADAVLFNGLEEPRFYFVHSYHAECPKEYMVATAHYGYEFVASVQRENIYGVQFHPEKSHRFGMQVYRNFLNL